MSALRKRSPTEMEPTRRTLADRATARRAAIIETARQVFLEKGYSDASMAEISERIGGSKATLYSYFPSKGALFAAVAKERADAAAAVLGRPAECGEDLETVLRALARRHLASVFDRNDVAFYRMIVAEAERFPEIGAYFYTRIRSLIAEPLVPFLQDAIDAGEVLFEDLQAAGELFFDLCVGTQHRRALMGQPPSFERSDIERRIDMAVAQFLALCGSSQAWRIS